MYTLLRIMSHNIELYYMMSIVLQSENVLLNIFWIMPNITSYRVREGPIISMDHSGYGCSQWKTTLYCNDSFLWLSPYPDWPLIAKSSSSKYNKYNDVYSYALYPFCICSINLDHQTPKSLRSQCRSIYMKSNLSAMITELPKEQHCKCCCCVLFHPYIVAAHDDIIWKLFTWMAIYEENSPVTGSLPSKWAKYVALLAFFDLILQKLLSNQSVCRRFWGAMTLMRHPCGERQTSMLPCFYA